MAVRRLYVAVVVVLALAFAFLPFVPYSTNNDRLAFISQRTTAQVSPSYYLFHCGVVYSPTNTTSIGSVTVSVPIWSGARLVCAPGGQLGASVTVQRA